MADFVRIGVMDKACEGWTSGGEFSRVQAASLLAAVKAGADASVTVITPRADRFRVPPLSVGPKVEFAAPFRAEWLSLQRRLTKMALSPLGVWKDPRTGDWEKWARGLGVDVFLSFVPWDWWMPCGVATCCSIPDFQHLHLPSYFGAEELKARDESCRDQAEKTDLAILHSQDVMCDFRRQYPHCADKPRLYRFPSLLCFEDISASFDHSTVLQRYGIERQFLLVMNQFWAHKNHAVVIEALGILKKRHGGCPQVVMIGQTSDTRDPGGKTMSALLGRIAELGLEGRAKLLGFVPADVRDVLIRTCQAMVQPSRFEGWNTAIEDAKAIGRPVIASELAVHREQLAAPFGFFDVDDAEGLALLLHRAATDLTPGPDRGAEQREIELSRRNAIDEANALIGYCRDAAAAVRAGGHGGTREVRRGNIGRHGITGEGAEHAAD
ncbi:MAG: glycosyltransferase family 4 protein [Lentisphaerae bacterium]|nr:glycosyltransferase family 4 protein [Lentisphaerota bacterium]